MRIVVSKSLVWAVHLSENEAGMRSNQAAVMENAGIIKATGKKENSRFLPFP